MMQGNFAQSVCPILKRADIDNILESCSVKPMVNQILAHISNTPTELIQYTQDQGILGVGSVFTGRTRRTAEKSGSCTDRRKIRRYHSPIKHPLCLAAWPASIAQNCKSSAYAKQCRCEFCDL